MRRALLVTILGLALAGCGGGDGEELVAPEPEPAPAATTEAPDPEPEPEPERETSTAAEPEPESEPEAAPGLPAALAGYTSWPRLNARPIPPRDADPHSGTKDVFASVPAEDGVYPNGAIVVKEATRPGADFIGLVAMMRKQAGANPDHNDWVMVEWTRDAPDAPFAEVASGAVCTGCHVQVRDRDYVFTRG